MTELLLAYVLLERLIELAISRRNTKRLLAQGAVEVGAKHYPFMVLLHVMWAVAIVLWIVTRKPEPNVFFASVYLLLQIFRFWVMLSLGRFWTTRIITLPGAPLVKRGPYKFLRHPNYVVVALEVAVLPLVWNALSLAAAFTILNGWMLSVRIDAEERALSARR
jgi:methyltransferase